PLGGILSNINSAKASCSFGERADTAAGSFSLIIAFPRCSSYHPAPKDTQRIKAASLHDIPAALTDTSAGCDASRSQSQLFRCVHSRHLSVSDSFYGNFALLKQPVYRRPQHLLTRADYIHSLLRFSDRNRNPAFRFSHRICKFSCPLCRCTQSCAIPSSSDP